MSQSISQLRPSKPVDCTLPHHGMYRQTEDDKWQVNLYMLFKNLPKPRGSRAVWYKTSQNMVHKLPRDIFGREIREIGVTNGAKVIHIRRLKSDPGVNLLS